MPSRHWFVTRSLNSAGDMMEALTRPRRVVTDNISRRAELRSMHLLILHALIIESAGDLLGLKRVEFLAPVHATRL